MKKTYIQPGMLAVVLLQQNNLLQNGSSTVTGVISNEEEIGMGNGNVTGGGDVKGSTNVWDEEW